MNEDRINIRDAARKLGVSDNFVRMGLQQGRLPFGIAVNTTPKTPTSRGRWVYYINKKALDKYIKGEL